MTVTDRALRTDALRSDVDPKDFMRVINGIWYLPDSPQWRDDVGRMLELVIDGLRYGVPDRRTHAAPQRRRSPLKGSPALGARRRGKSVR